MKIFKIKNWLPTFLNLYEVLFFGMCRLSGDGYRQSAHTKEVAYDASSIYGAIFLIFSKFYVFTNLSNFHLKSFLCKFRKHESRLWCSEWPSMHIDRLTRVSQHRQKKVAHNVLRQHPEAIFDFIANFILITNN